jgi:hypothetical protein
LNQSYTRQGAAAEMQIVSLGFSASPASLHRSRSLRAAIHELMNKETMP